MFGYPIDVYQESINKTFTEYLVNYNYFNDLMNVYGFKLVSNDDIRTMGLPSSSGLFSELFKIVKDNHNGKDKLGETLSMSDNEKEISFLNRYFIYKKIRNYNGDVNIMTGQDEQIDNNMTKEEYILNKLPQDKKDNYMKLDQNEQNNLLYLYSQMEEYKPPSYLKGEIISKPLSPDEPPP